PDNPAALRGSQPNGLRCAPPLRAERRPTLNYFIAARRWSTSRPFYTTPYPIEMACRLMATPPTLRRNVSPLNRSAGFLCIKSNRHPTAFRYCNLHLLIWCAVSGVIMVNVDEKLEPVLQEVLRRNAGELEFHQAVREV